jgi:hypothetical protein
MREIARFFLDRKDNQKLSAAGRYEEIVATTQSSATRVENLHLASLQDFDLR